MTIEEIKTSVTMALVKALIGSGLKFITCPKR